MSVFLHDDTFCGRYDMLHLLLPIIYLAFIGLGLPDSLLGSAWPAMYEELGAPLRSVGHRRHDHLRRHHRLQPYEQQGGQAIRDRRNDGGEHGDDSGRTRGLFLFILVFRTLSLGDSLRAGGGKHRRRAEQLRRAALRIEAYDLAALLLGNRREQRAPSSWGCAWRTARDGTRGT